MTRAKTSTNKVVVASRTVRRGASNPPGEAQYPSVRPGEYTPWVTERIMAVERVTAEIFWAREAANVWLGSAVSPNPQAARTPRQFIAQLHALRVWGGSPTLRELENRAGAGRLPRSSISDMLRRTDRLPKIDLLAAYVKACGAGETLQAWVAAWHRLNKVQPTQPVARRQAA